jgi:hypothetical protein
MKSTPHPRPLILEHLLKPWSSTSTPTHLLHPFTDLFIDLRVVGER